MQLGGLKPVGQASVEIKEGDLDLRALDAKIDQVKQLQIYTMIAIAVIALLLLKNGKN